jgi:hypothetical protein
LILFADDRWQDDFHDFFFIVDAKLPTKKAAGEKYLEESIVRTLGSRPGHSLVTSERWKGDPDHPFEEKFSVDHGRVRGRDVGSAIDLNLLFEHGIAFEDSTDHPGLQLADLVANVVRRAVLTPNSKPIQCAYDLLRPKLRTLEGPALRIHRLSTSQQDHSSLERYRPLYGPAR